jgi:hypothetical protein
MDRSTRYHAREFEKSLVAIKEGNQKRLNVATANLKASEDLAASYKHLSEVQHMKIGEQDFAIKNVYEPLVLRLYLLERLVLHTSLDKPPLVGYTLPEQSWGQHKVMGELIYELRHAGDERLNNLESIMYTDELAQEERDRSIEKWIDGVAIPHPTAPDNNVSTSDSGSQGFEIVSMRDRGRPSCKLEDVGDPTPTSSI